MQVKLEGDLRQKKTTLGLKKYKNFEPDLKNYFEKKKKDRLRAQTGVVDKTNK